MCNNNFIFVDNSNISNIHPFDDSLDFVKLDRYILANNIDHLNNSLLTHLHHPGIRIHTM